jgi:hypothetical protein
MFDLPVSPPDSPYDFQVLLETCRGRLDQSDYDTLSILYGLSSLDLFRDEDFCREVEEYLTSSPDPVLARYKFAYYLASIFWEYFSQWQYRQVEHLDGKRWEKITEGEPGYVGELSDEFRKMIMDWLLAGIEAFREDDELMQLVRWLKYRLEMSDTSLTRAEIQVLEQALGEEIDFHKDRRAQALVQQTIRALEEQRKRNAEEQG